MLIRPRRNRSSLAMRKMVRETRTSTDSLMYPLFVIEGENRKRPISSLEGQYHYSPDQLVKAVDEARETGVNAFLLFGLPTTKDAVGSGAYDENGVVQQALRKLRTAHPDSLLMTDVCMCEYTDHGHCGILKKDGVDNDATLPYLAKIALSHARAGADIVAPSDMMDGRVKAIREILEKNDFVNTAIMSYAVKYASAFYGPFREAAKSAPGSGDRKGYQMDYHNAAEALREAALDVQEGADSLIVKPAMSYLDIVRRVKDTFDLPIAAYSVSGEYAMMKAAAAKGYMDEYGSMCESAIAAYRAGATIYITYFAKELALAMKRGDIG